MTVIGLIHCILNTTSACVWCHANKISQLINSEAILQLQICLTNHEFLLPYTLWTGLLCLHASGLFLGVGGGALSKIFVVSFMATGSKISR